MRYVGIDPSTKTGHVILNEEGNPVVCWEITSKIKQDPQRFMDLTNDVLLNLVHGDIICIEGFSYGSKGKGVSTQYGIGWLIRAELIRNGYTYIDVPPTSVKKFATGKGNAKKDAMVLPIFKHWGFEHISDNVRDAYVLAQMAKSIHDTSNLTKYQIEALEKVTG
jgi:crossover junction endodeoxyribonuclease RuvC